MTEEKEQMLNRLDFQIKKLLHHYEVLSEENEFLVSQIQKLLHELEETEKKYSLLESKYNNLKLANAFALSDEEKLLANKRFSKLVREINTCISLLND
ncbi:MAG: hypothetical protein ACRC77_10660 [Bacteroidales bacterium]